MSDNTTITEGVGKIIASDEITGVNYQRIKLIHGADGTNDGDVSSANPLPVSLPTATVTTLTPPAAITGFATSAKQLADGHNVAVASIAAGTALIGKVGIDQATAKANEVVTKTGSVTTATLGAETTKVIGTVNVAAAQTIAVTNAGLTALNGAITGTEVQVDVLTMPTVTVNAHAVTNAGTFATQATLAAETTKVIGTVNVASSQTIAATNSTAANLKAEVVGTGTFAVQNTDSLIAATFVVKTVDFSASATAQPIWDPTAGKKFVITDIVCSASAAGVITLFDQTDNATLRIAKLNLAANGGAVINYRKPYVSATADNILNYTTGSVVAGSISISGYEI